QGDGLSASDPGRADLSCSQLRDGSGCVGHAVQGLVVECQQGGVCGRVDVRLEGVVTERDRVLECLEGILGEMARATAVRERQWQRMIKESRWHADRMPGSYRPS